MASSNDDIQGRDTET